MTAIISLPNAVKNQIIVAMTNVIDTIGKDCRIYYPSKLIVCTNCTSTGIWKTGGPMPFTFGVCPLCGGQNKVKTQETYDNIKMTLDWRIEKYLYLFKNLNIRDPKNTVLSRGYIYNMMQVAQSDYMKIIGVDAYKHFNFKLIAEPVDPHNLAPGQFFLALWERNG